VKLRIRWSAESVFLVLSGICSENIESGPGLGLAADRCVSEDQRRAWYDKRADILEKRWLNRDTIFEIL
jgi:hypothetical protein